MKLLLLDIETAPNLAATWGLYDQNIALDQLLTPGYTLCWSAKWHGSKEIMFESIVTGEKRMVNRVYKLLNEADAVCHYNGTKFDIPTLNKEFLLNKLTPPAPFKQIDLLKTARKRFRLASNKLDFVAQQLGLGSKTKHKGMGLWLGCMKKNKEDWAVMEEYNKQDVLLLEKVYDRLLPWIEGHPNLSVMEGASCCTKCGSDSFQARGYRATMAGVYPQYRCNSCGSWFRGVRREKTFNDTFREAR
jgi:hypothetical protein